MNMGYVPQQDASNSELISKLRSMCEVVYIDRDNTLKGLEMVREFSNVGDYIVVRSVKSNYLPTEVRKEFDELGLHLCLIGTFPVPINKIPHEEINEIRSFLWEDMADPRWFYPQICKGFKASQSLIKTMLVLFDVFEYTRFISADAAEYLNMTISGIQHIIHELCSIGVLTFEMEHSYDVSQKHPTRAKDRLMRVYQFPLPADWKIPDGIGVDSNLTTIVIDRLKEHKQISHLLPNISNIDFHLPTSRTINGHPPKPKKRDVTIEECHLAVTAIHECSYLNPIIHELYADFGHDCFTSQDILAFNYDWLDVKTYSNLSKEQTSIVRQNKATMIIKIMLKLRLIEKSWVMPNGYVFRHKSSIFIGMYPIVSNPRLVDLDQDYQEIWLDGESKRRIELARQEIESMKKLLYA